MDVLAHLLQKWNFQLFSTTVKHQVKSKLESKWAQKVKVTKK